MNNPKNSIPVARFRDDGTPIYDCDIIVLPGHEDDVDFCDIPILSITGNLFLGKRAQLCHVFTGEGIFLGDKSTAFSINSVDVAMFGKGTIVVKSILSLSDIWFDGEINCPDVLSFGSIFFNGPIIDMSYAKASSEIYFGLGSNRSTSISEVDAPGGIYADPPNVWFLLTCC